MGILVAQAAPDFTAKAVMPNNEIKENFNLTAYLNNQEGVIIFYPLDFTFVCPTEIIAINNRIGKFTSRGAKVLIVSVDSANAHLAWKMTPINKGGIGNVQFPMVADLTKSIARDYGVLYNNAVAFRATFLIDKKGIIRHQLVNDLPIGRNIDETLRTLDALIEFEKHGEVCPAGWKDGDETMRADNEGVAHYLASNAENL